MLVQRGEISPAERTAFDRIVRAFGREPAEFLLMVFTAAAASRLRTVHVAVGHAAAQYDASAGNLWTQSFARHLEEGHFH